MENEKKPSWLKLDLNGIQQSRDALYQELKIYLDDELNQETHLKADDETRGFYEEIIYMILETYDNFLGMFSSYVENRNFQIDVREDAQLCPFQRSTIKMAFFPLEKFLIEGLKGYKSRCNVNSFARDCVGGAGNFPEKFSEIEEHFNNTKYASLFAECEKNRSLYDVFMKIKSGKIAIPNNWKGYFINTMKTMKGLKK